MGSILPGIQRKTPRRMVQHLSKYESFNDKYRCASYFRVFHFSKKDIWRYISIYFYTNIKNHHHFFDVKENLLIDIESNKIELKNIPSPPNGKKIKDIDVIINVENGSQ